MSLKQISTFFNYSKWYSILEVQYSKLESKYLLILGSFDTRSCQTTAYSILEKIVFDLPLISIRLASQSLWVPTLLTNQGLLEDTISTFNSTKTVVENWRTNYEMFWWRERTFDGKKKINSLWNVSVLVYITND